MLFRSVQFRVRINSVLFDRTKSLIGKLNYYIRKKNLLGSVIGPVVVVELKVVVIVVSKSISIESDVKKTYNLPDVCSVVSSVAKKQMSILLTGKKVA